MTDQHVTLTPNPWRDQIEAAQTLLDELRPQLIEAEANMAERLAAISAFEFQVRSRFEPLTRRLDALQADIDDLRRRLRTLRFAWEDDDESFAATSNRRGSQWEFGKEGAASAGNFRYREQTVEFAPPTLPAEELAELRQMYRQLARRFHPDLALDEEDRAYRTSLMMIINTAYAAGDLAQLQQIALEPDLRTDANRSEQQLAESLAREVERCRLRLAEIDKELAALERHESTQLMRRVERAAAEGRDLLNELAADLRRRINEKMVERDVLQTQLEESNGDDEPDTEDLAETLYDLGLEEAGDAAFMAEFANWRAGKKERWTDEWSEDDIEDILDDRD